MDFLKSPLSGIFVVADCSGALLGLPCQKSVVKNGVLAANDQQKLSIFLVGISGM